MKYRNRFLKTLSIITGILLLSGCGGQAKAPDTESTEIEEPGALSSEMEEGVTAGIISEVYSTLPEELETEEASEAETEESTETESTEDATEEKKVYTPEEYAAAGVNELNSVPVIMYHGIFDMTNGETQYTGGNVDKNGNNRTWEAFTADLDTYYEMGYRCMRLTDYIDGNIDVPFGYSPLILTFDDGLHEADLEGFDEMGNPVFSPHSAIGVLEACRQKYPDFNVTATFFLNSFLVDPPSTDEERLKVVHWLVDNGYDVGNHTLDHAQLSKCSAEEITRQVGGMYKILEETIPGQYVNIVALPYGDPADMYSDSKYECIVHGEYEGFSYESKGVLRSSYTRQYSPFSTEWDPISIRRIRGYDNNGEDFDLKMNFEQLNEGKRYISDGDPNTIVIPTGEAEERLKETGGREVIRY